MEKNDEYLLKLEKYAETLRGAKLYSVQRIDLLVISISGAGIYTCFEVMKYIASDNALKKYLFQLALPFKCTGILLTLAIVLNFISQWCAYKGSSLALESTKKQIFSIENEIHDSVEVSELDKIALRYNQSTKTFNFLSALVMIIGLTFLIVFISSLF